MKRVVKLDRRQLRGLIKEAIQAREPGGPLFEAPYDPPDYGPPPEPELRAKGTKNPQVQSAIKDLASILSADLAGDHISPDAFTAAMIKDLHAAVEQVWKQHMRAMLRDQYGDAYYRDGQ